MSMIEPDQGRTIGPDPVGPAPEPEPVVEAQVEDTRVEAAEPDTFDRKYVEELRRENAKWRTQAQQYNEVFGDLDDEDKQAWFQIIDLANSGDPDAIQYLGQALGFVGEEAPESQVPSDEFLTREQAVELAREIAREEARAEAEQRDAVRNHQQQIDTIQSRAKNEFGVEPGSDDYVLLLHRANQLDPSDVEGGDLLAAAHAQLQAEKQAQWDAFVAQKTQAAAGSPIIAPGNGMAPSTAQTPKSWAEARNSLHERLSNQG